MRYIFFGDENFHDDIAVRLANAGFERCADIEEASAIITFCTSQSALEDAYFDEGGFVQSAHPGAVLVDFSGIDARFRARARRGRHGERLGVRRGSHRS